MDAFISKEILDMLSYQLGLGQSLKQISLQETPLERILDDIAKYRSSYIDVLLQENLIDSRFKSEDSILRKYEKTLRTGGGFKVCFNDVLGFRLRFEEYPDAFPNSRSGTSSIPRILQRPDSNRTGLFKPIKEFEGEINGR